MQPSPAGTQRRARALFARGWTEDSIAEATGIPAPSIRRSLGDRRRISPELAASVAVACERIWDQPAPRTTPEERRDSDAARAHARRCGWPPQLGWDDDEIALPDGEAAPGWKRTSTTARSADVAEDVRYLRDTGYRFASHSELALRLGMPRDRLETALRRERIARLEDQREAG
jgi:transcriptional regulator with XRE-family HTH domain